MAKKKNNVGSVVAHFWIYVLLILLTILSILPFWIMFMNATRSTPEINANSLGLIPSKYLARNWNVIGTKSFNAMTGFINSMIISTGATVLSVYFSSMTAYSIVAYRWKLRRAFFTFIMAVLMIWYGMKGRFPVGKPDCPENRPQKEDKRKWQRHN